MKLLEPWDIYEASMLLVDWFEPGFHFKNKRALQHQFYYNYFKIKFWTYLFMTKKSKGNTSRDGQYEKKKRTHVINTVLNFTPVIHY